MKKLIVVGIIILFVGAGIIPSTGVIVEKATSMDSKSGGYIQGLIDNASDGDTIYIPSGIYYENIVINKSINLVGEDKDTTIIDGSWQGDVITIFASQVNISGFTIQNSGNESEDNGINIFESNNHNTIIGNIVTNDRNGIYLRGSSYNVITGNNISDNKIGILLDEGFWGFPYSQFDSCENIIIKNNFLDNKLDAFFLYCFTHGPPLNYWNQNYWKKPRLLVKIIYGAFTGYRIIFPWFNIDWHPAQEPYDIGG